jgi:hypothetical protein
MSALSHKADIPHCTSHVRFISESGYHLTSKNKKKEGATLHG